jgi:hypothetical protein
MTHTLGIILALVGIAAVAVLLIAVLGSRSTTAVDDGISTRSEEP